jgi:hypothetical protein
MSDKDEAIEILNWTQRASEMWMVKLSYVSKAGSEQYAKPISKTVFRDNKTHPRDLIIQLSMMLDETLNKRNKTKGLGINRLYDNTIRLNNEKQIDIEDNNATVLHNWLMKSWANDALLLFVCGRQMVGAEQGSLSFYTTWNQMTQDNSEPYGIILKIKRVKIK